MSNPFLGMINIVGFNFAPRGYALCDGQILPIAQNQALFSLLGTTYGGDGRTSFALPDLRGRVAIHEDTSQGGTNHALGQRGGEENHTLTVGEMPGHDHTINASTAGATTNSPTAGLVLANANIDMYRGPPPTTALNPESVTSAGASQGHENMMPFGTLSFIIALQGLFPSRN